jgi:hypothetical protein
MKPFILITIVLVLSSLLLFKIIHVKRSNVGIVFSIWNGKTSDYLLPGNHIISRFSGFTNAHWVRHTDVLKIGNHTYNVVNEPVHDETEPDFYKKYTYAYFQPFMASFHFNDSIKGTMDTSFALSKMIIENAEIRKHIRISAMGVK